MDKYGLPIMPCIHIFTSRPLNPGRKVDRSTGEEVRNTHNTRHSLPVNPGRQVDRLTRRQVNKYGIPIMH